MLQDKIIYNASDIIRSVEHKLDQLKPFQYDSRYRALLGEHFVQKINDWEHNISSRKDDPFTLVVCGEFKRGKSSLINAILGDDVVPVNVTTETVTLNRISYGPHANEAVLSGGRRLILSDEDLNRYNLEALMQKLGEPIRQLELRRPIDLLKRVTVVDTPGLGDALQDFSELVSHALSQADAVIYVFSTNYPLSRSEQLFLKTQVLPQKYTDLFLVANYSDMMRNMQDYERMRDFLQVRIDELMPGWEFSMLSALDERCIQLGEERPNEKLADVLECSFLEFRDKLEKLVEQKQSMVIPTRMQRLMHAMAEDLTGLLDAMDQGLKMSTQDVQDAMEQANARCEQQTKVQEGIRQKIIDLIEKLSKQASGWMLELLTNMENELLLLNDVPVENLKKYYTFYCVDTVQQGMDKCLDYHTEVIYDMLDDISSELTGALVKEKKDSYSFRFALDNHTWTKGDNVSYIASKLPFISSLSLIVDGITGAMREKELQKGVPNIIEQIREQYYSFRASVEKAIADAYAGMCNNVIKQLDLYHTAQIEQVKIQVEQSALVARQDETHKEEIHGIINQVRNILDMMQNTAE